ncbi:tyrosine-type recombinase/integrase [Caulobacter segnis]|uniref:tyrosine-type recombinase/integrase n=1 Tax=Caulobacter segnis TaxID=88688 RepID=UPI002410874C|nr:tyrosine-type recombinase/integrase [Caulobacter segnis]MDG2522965.1 tyrosine-type recombinase/integrase [Caulobacter segnis]
MGARVKLTKRLVDAATARSQDYFIWDSEVVGFGLKVTPAGRRTYVVQYRVEGRSRRFNIGLHGSPWTVETARGRALALQGKVVEGSDPQAKKAVDRKAITIAQMCELYLTEGLATRKPGSVATARSDLDNHIKPMIGAVRAASVTPEDVDKLLLDIAAGKSAVRRRTGKRRGVSRVRGGKGAANSAIATLGAAFTFAIRRGVRPDNPVRGVRKFPEKKLERFLSPRELARLGEALAAAEALGVENPFAVYAIRLLVLTGCRKNEILGLHRVWIDTHNRCLRLPDSKTGSKVVHLGAAALEVIQGIPEVVGNPYLLPGRGEVGRLADLQSAWERIRAAAGLQDVRIHDLRHAFASLGVAGGDSLVIVGALLGHRTASTTQRYSHLADHPLKAAADRISHEAATMMGLKAAAEPKPLRAVAAAPAPGQGGLLGAVVETKWLDTPAAAAYLGHTVGTLQTYRWMGTGPRFRKIGRRVVYAQGDLDAWRNLAANAA